MLSNVEQIEKLSALARRRAKEFQSKSINEKLVSDFIDKGWEVVRKNKNTIQIKKTKPHGTWLEDRVWNLFYKMGFAFLSGEGGGKMMIINQADSPVSQIDIVGIDHEVAIAVECKSQLNYAKRSQFQEELGKFTLLKEGFVKNIRQQYPVDHKRQIIFAMFLSKVTLTEQDKERAKNANITLFDEKDLSYYEHLVAHLGPAAKYQILSDMIPGKEIPGLSIRIPAIKIKMGGSNCYNFSISPEYLLKIAYVSHRSKGKVSDINTYQRMLKKQRLKNIQKYILNEGIFPTNIILNFEKNRLLFEKVKQETESDTTEVGILGWLVIKPTYKSAWVIDGQHRLFSYSGLDMATKSKLSILAFEGLKPSKQAELFIDINAKQTSVKKSLLEELYAELHWDSDQPEIRVRAIISKCIQDINNDHSSALFERIQTTDGGKDQLRCITITSLFSQLENKGVFISKERKGDILQYGPLWGGNDNEATLKRTSKVLNFLFNTIKEKNVEWWNIGSGIGGGLAMNDGVATCISVLRSIFETLETNHFRGKNLVSLDDDELIEAIEKYVEALASYLASLSETQRKSFRDLRGAQGVTVRTRQCQQGIRHIMPRFNPDGLDEWVETQKMETNKRAKEIIDNVEVSLQSYLIAELKNEFGSDELEWWMQGVPKTVRQKVSQRFEDEEGKRGSKEHYFDLVDYQKIILENWNLFENTFGYGKGGKDKKTHWLHEINEMRKIVSHASSGKTIPIDELNNLENYWTWLEGQLSQIAENIQSSDSDK